MDVQLGIYEIFSTIIPGIVYLAAIGELLVLTGVMQLNWETLNNLSIVSAVFILVAAYLLGVMFGGLGLGWYKIFKRKDQSVESLEALKLRHKDRWNIDFDDDDWHVLLAFVRSKNLDLARENERHLASSIMLRNVSFGFLLLTIINLVQYLLDKNLVLLIACLGLFILSILMIRQAMRFRRWYYDSILSSVLAYRIELEKSIQAVEPLPKPRNRKRKTDE